MNKLLLVGGIVLAILGILAYSIPYIEAWNCERLGYWCALNVGQVYHPEYLIMVPIGVLIIAYVFVAQKPRTSYGF